ncbi:hypothetical protein [uncultured Gilvimarinus sp.]|uniref:hypothetical protein n=1 Tax=uncultured Gilvimarinus sp. TaxID=1689143 RepID=UPI0030EDAFF7|tara:strand:- start:22 stop:189 length:168 start_codon:yes stop_codon:yes gene_type:complete
MKTAHDYMMEAQAASEMADMASKRALASRAKYEASRARRLGLDSEKIGKNKKTGR